MHSQAGCGSFKLRQVILPNPRSQRQSLLRSTAVPKQSHAPLSPALAQASPRARPCHPFLFLLPCITGWAGLPVRKGGQRNPCNQAPSLRVLVGCRWWSGQGVLPKCLGNYPQHHPSTTGSLRKKLVLWRLSALSGGCDLCQSMTENMRDFSVIQHCHGHFTIFIIVSVQ